MHVQDQGMLFAQKTFLVFIISGAALIFNPWRTTEVFEWPKLIFFLVSVSFFTLLNIFDFVSSRNNYFLGLKQFVRKPEIIFLALFLIGHLIAFIFSTNQSVSLVGSGMRFQGLLTQLFYVLFGCNAWYVFSRNDLAEEKNFIVIVRFLIALLVLACVIALVPYFFPKALFLFDPALFSGRAFGTLGNPNYLAAFIVSLAPFLFIAGKNVFVHTRSVLFLWPSIGLVLVTLFLTGSRGAWLATLIGFLVFGTREALRNHNAKTLLVTAGLLLVLVVGFFAKGLLQPYAPQFNRLALDTPESSSIQSRFVLWKTGLKMAHTRPLTGFGQDMIVGNVEPFLPKNLRANAVFYIDRLHNEFIDILVSAGAVTLIGYTGFLFVVWRRALSRYKKEGNIYVGMAVLALSILVMFQAINFSTVTSNTVLAFLLAYLLAEPYTGQRTDVPFIIDRISGSRAS